MGQWEAKPANAEGGSLTISAPAMTRAACPPGSMDSRIARDLAGVRTYTLRGDTLNLSVEGDVGVYTWERLAQ